MFQSSLLILKVQRQEDSCLNVCYTYYNNSKWCENFTFYHFQYRHCYRDIVPIYIETYLSCNNKRDNGVQFNHLKSFRDAFSGLKNNLTLQNSFHLKITKIIGKLGDTYVNWTIFICQIKYAKYNCSYLFRNYNSFVTIFFIQVQAVTHTDQLNKHINNILYTFDYIKYFTFIVV